LHDENVKLRDVRRYTHQQNHSSDFSIDDAMWMTYWHPDHCSCSRLLLQIANPNISAAFQNYIETALIIMGMFFHLLARFQAIQTHQNVFVLK
jgi:hypothetical protein